MKLAILLLLESSLFVAILYCRKKAIQFGNKEEWPYFEKSEAMFKVASFMAALMVVIFVIYLSLERSNG